ncbi:hypothetical protein CHS0354_014976 [Potamilus streckersoni]|uniref:SRCR domain-containing protein n=1 Tax=Potamilus streckersoni TaxID=2493646 RepID=A0AAE0SAA2_9BIVA|nr:hypothetical protein CHS0354_014976 [Potamilus streckersoni]
MFFKNQWRYVQKEKWNSAWTRTACESMHFNYGGSWHENSVFGVVPSELKLWKIKAECLNPINCSKSEIVDGSSDAIGITCYTEILNSSNVRLVNKNITDSKEGYVELLYRNEWGTVCNKDWDSTDVKVLCQMMNMQGNGAEDGTPYLSNSVTAKVWTDGVKCTGNEKSIFECENKGWNKTISPCLKSGAKCKP